MYLKDKAKIKNLTFFICSKFITLSFCKEGGGVCQETFSF